MPYIEKYTGLTQSQTMLARVLDALDVVTIPVSSYESEKEHFTGRNLSRDLRAKRKDAATRQHSAATWTTKAV